MSSLGVFVSLALALVAPVSPPVRDGGGEVRPEGASGPSSAARGATITMRAYPTVVAALKSILERQPRVLAVGEYHQTTKTARIPSALMRFTRELLPSLRAAGATHLIVETWMTTGECGATERKAVAQVEKTTKRPAQTESEVVTLLRRAKEAGIQPGILEVTCADYQAMLAGRQVDFERLLRLTRDQLETQLRAALARKDSRLVLSYGGALHNDLHPTGEVAPFAFGPAIASAVSGGYVELDLYVPELVERNPTVRAQPWFAAYRRAYRPGRVMVVRFGDRSFGLVFPRSRRKE